MLTAGGIDGVPRSKRTDLLDARHANLTLYLSLSVHHAEENKRPGHLWIRLFCEAQDNDPACLQLLSMDKQEWHHARTRREALTSYPHR